jgi:hypothetical protein
MFRIPLPARDTNLLLAPRWGDGTQPLPLLLWLLVGLVPLLLVLWLYRHELRLVRRGVAVGLLGLRLLVLVLVFFLVCFQPIVAHSTSEELPGRVLVAVDRTDSMSVADPQRPNADKLRLARALKLAAGIATDADLDNWIKQYEEKGTVSWVNPSEFPTEPGRRQALEAERRKGHDQVCERVDRLTRSQVAQQILAADGLDFLSAIAARHQVELLGFARDPWEVDVNQLDKLFAPPDPAQAAEGQSAAVTAFTDLRAPLVRAVESSGPDQAKVLGLVLLTDGQHNSGLSPVPKALEVGEHNIPIYPIALGARQAPADISVVSVQAPTAVFKDVDVSVAARIKISDLPAQDVVVELQRPGQPPLQERLHHDGADRYHTVRFQTRLDKPGTQPLSVTVQPVKGEICKDNNSRPVLINVADDRARVLLIDGEARWEYHYLARALERDPTVQVQSVVFTQPRLEKIAEEELEKSGNPRLTLPAGPDALAAYDCIILGDVDPEQLPLADRRRLERYVGDRGGTLVVLAGKRFMPTAYRRPAREAGTEEDPLLKLLPLEEPFPVQRPDGFPVTLSPDGKTTLFLQLEPTPADNEARWAGLPRHFWGVIGRTKPGAAALAIVRDEDAPLDAQNQGSLERQQALIARHNYGFGRVLFVGLDSTWRWRYKTGDTYHHRFWGQVVRWAASDKPLVAGNEHVRFGTRDAVYRQGQEIELTVRLNEETVKLKPDALAGARILRQGQDQTETAVALVPLARREAQPQVLEGRIRDLPAGNYAIKLDIPDLEDKLHGPAGPDGKPGKLRSTFMVAPPEGDEMVELATNWPLLEELAAKSGGKVFTPENALDLIALLNQQIVTREHYDELRLWQWWVMLVVLLSLLTVEWVARKWAGLP